ncbi:type IV secretion system DNA-binding domain-containing protein, partial [Aliarcobacter butzleri]|uniref:type IV secretion system DNA-binding domain-containing protein n=1 Tax=Aliarcobacter butzleri TaxID=28197 RepID=UPI003AF7F486
ILVIIKFAINFFTNSLLNREDNISQRHQMVENRDYTNIQNLASYPNPLSQSRGYKFTTLLQMKFFEMEKKVKGKSLIHLDNYAFFPQMVNRSDLRKNPLLAKKLNESVKVSLNAKDFTKQIIVLGGMGSGKTEFVNNIVEQVHTSNFENMKSIIYNDIKGDFKQKFYRADKDYLINLFDKESSVWCIFSEMKHNIEAGTNFVNNLFQSIAGDDKDFFIGRAKQLTAQWIQEAYFSTDNNIDAWEMFFIRIKSYEKKLEEEDDRTKSSILQTILIALEILSIMRYQIVIEKRKIFCINEFIYETDTQLFLVNNKQYEAKLTPYLVGLWGAINSAIMCKPDIPEEEENPHLILFVLDEGLSVPIDEATRKSMLTLTRSKGACNIILGQYLNNNEKLIQDIDSSRYALVTFNINDDFTLEKVSKKFASAEMLSVTASPQVKDNQENGQQDNIGISAINEILSKGKNQDNFTYSLGNTEVIALQQLQSMPKYHHLTFIPSEEVKTLNSEDSLRNFKLLAFGYEDLMKDIAVSNNEFLSRESGILYLGYTPQSSLNFNNPPFVQWNMEDYYKDSLKENASTKISLDEKTAFTHYMNIAFAETQEKAEEYIINNDLVSFDIDHIFIEVEENSEKILQLMAKYSEEERYELMDMFFDIPKDDIEKKYEFCKTHDLIGAILGIFTFSDKFRISKIGE